LFKRFKEGRGEIEDDLRPGRPSTSKPDANIAKVSEIVRKYRFLSIRAVAELANIDRESVGHILHEHFNLKCGKTAHGFFTMTTYRHTTHCLSRRFWRSSSSLCWNIHLTHLT
jgi:phosphopantothenate synthetase